MFEDTHDHGDDDDDRGVDDGGAEVDLPSPLSSAETAWKSAYAATPIMSTELTRRTIGSKCQKPIVNAFWVRTESRFATDREMRPATVRETTDITASMSENTPSKRIANDPETRPNPMPSTETRRIAARETLSACCSVRM